MKKYLILVLGILSILPVFPQNQNKIERLSEYLEYLEEKDRFMGSLTIHQDEKEVFNEIYGISQKIASKEIPSKLNAVYRIGSISKTFTAVMYMQMIDEGLITLDTKLSEFYPNIENSKKISVQNLLQHQSGISNVTNREDYFDWCYQAISKEEMLNKIMEGGIDFEPGDHFEYSNSNYILLGYIMEQITKESFDENLQKRIAIPLKLKSIKVGGQVQTHQNEVLSFSYENGWSEDLQTDMSVPHGAGAIIANTKDLSAFADAVFGGKFLSKEGLNRMTALENGIGMGCFMNPFYDLEGIGHSGGIDSYSSNLVYFGPEKVSIAFTSNGLRLDMNEVLIGILSIYFERDFEFPVYTDYQLNPEDLKPCFGTYECKKQGLIVDLYEEDGQLHGLSRGQGEFNLEASSPNSYVNYMLDAEFIFQNKDKGSYQSFINKQAGFEMNFERIEE